MILSGAWRRVLRGRGEERAELGAAAGDPACDGAFGGVEQAGDLGVGVAVDAAEHDRRTGPRLQAREGRQEVGVRDVLQQGGAMRAIAARRRWRLRNWLNARRSPIV
ncbi:MAG: hypothetical protein U0838_10870 [Chloroflexota bacterium]